MGEDKKCPCDIVLEMKGKLEQHETRLADGNTNFALIQQTLVRIENEMAEIKADLRDLKEKPARKWEGITGKITDWAVLLLLAYMATQIGLQ